MYREGQTRADTSLNPTVFKWDKTKLKTQGIWQYTHQFEEFGVFYLSVWICPFDNQDPCNKHDEAHLVPGTGDTDENGDQIPKDEPLHQAFTVCPQGTDATKDDNSQMVLGSQLSGCSAQPGYFSPEGPGHIAEKCDETGFYCGLVGQTWPVARPGYWCVQIASRQMHSTKFASCKLSLSLLPEPLLCMQGQW